MNGRLEALRDVVPDEFLEALLLLMPDAEVAPSPGELAYFPCYDPEALDMGNRVFWTDPGAEPDLEYELEVCIPAGTICARGTWHGADPPGGLAVPQPRLWVVDPSAFEIARVVHRRPPAAPPASDDTEPM